MSAAAVTQHLTPDEYLAFERAAESKHEYCDGQVFAMAGCNRRHDTIASRVLRLPAVAVEIPVQDLHKRVFKDPLPPTHP